MVLKATNNKPIKEAITLTSFWQEFGPNKYPLNINELIEGTFNNSDFVGSLTTIYKPLDSIEGCLVRVPNTDEWKIVLNKKIKNVRRQRFTHAHELGHFVCHRHLDDKFEDSEDGLNDYNADIEQEANVFASHLLIPSNLLREEFLQKEWNTTVLRELGNRFQCSLQASALRFVTASLKRPIAFVVSRDDRIIWATKTDCAPYMEAYCFGDELPCSSDARNFSTKCEIATPVTNSGFAWNDFHESYESQYFDQSGSGYQYTCIEFDN